MRSEMALVPPWATITFVGEQQVITDPEAAVLGCQTEEGTPEFCPAGRQPGGSRPPGVTRLAVS